MRALSSWLGLLCIWINTTWALQASEAGVVDWHKSLVGVPLVNDVSTSPQFYRIGRPDGPTRSLVLVATSSHVLAALDPVGGEIAWRHILEDSDRVVAYSQHGDVVAALSGPGGAVLRVLDASRGHIITEKHLHSPESGRLLELETYGTALAFDIEQDSSDIYVLSNAHIVRRVDGNTGDVKWDWTAPDQSSLVGYAQLVAISEVVYVVGVAKSFASYTLHVTALSPATGELLASVDIPSALADGPRDLYLLSPANPRIVWLEDGVVKAYALTPELKGKSVTLKGYSKIIDVGLHDHGLLVGLKPDGSGTVLRLDDGGLQKIWDFSESATSKQYSPSTYSGGLDKENRPYIARVYWSRVLKKAAAQVFAPHLADGKGLVTGFSFPFDTETHGTIQHVTIDTANPEELAVISRLVLTTSTGAVQLWQQDTLQWTREEGLAEIRVAEIVELPERKAIEAYAEEENEMFADRIKRQLSDAQNFPRYVLNFATRFVTGSYASVSSSVAPAANTSEPLARDAFGFRKVIVAATPYGKVYGIDSANGAILWSRLFGLGWAAEIGAQVIPMKVFAIRTVSDGESPQVVLVTQRKAKNKLVDTVLFHIDATTGEDVRSTATPGGLLQGIDAIAGPLVEAYMLRTGTIKFLVLLDEFVQCNLYPDTEQTREAFETLVPSLHIPLRTGHPGYRRITGHRISPEVEFTGKHVAQPTWTLALAPSEEILAVVPRPQESVASLGKVLGNRTTLYKYLNPNMMAIVGGAGLPSPSCSLYVVDTAKGTLLYHVTIPVTPKDGVCDVKMAFMENWLVYAYYDGDTQRPNQAKSWRIISVEMYEGQGVDDKTRSSELSSFSNETQVMTIFEEAYVLPHQVTTMTTTSTSYGITIKDLIVATANNQIRSIPRRLLDPRRPKRKPTSQEAEEWLIQYDAVLPDDPKRVLSHYYQVAHPRQIISSPALLESTSLLFAYGLDLFSTRVAPSGTFDVLNEGFNKVQLVLTIGGLALGIAVARPMVARKKLKERWYD